MRPTKNPVNNRFRDPTRMTNPRVQSHMTQERRVQQQQQQEQPHHPPQHYRPQPRQQQQQQQQLLHNHSFVPHSNYPNFYHHNEAQRDPHRLPLRRRQDLVHPIAGTSHVPNCIDSWTPVVIDRFDGQPCVYDIKERIHQTNLGFVFAGVRHAAPHAVSLIVEDIATGLPIPAFHIKTTPFTVSRFVGNGARFYRTSVAQATLATMQEQFGSVKSLPSTSFGSRISVVLNDGAEIRPHQNKYKYSMICRLREEDSFHLGSVTIHPSSRCILNDFTVESSGDCMNWTTQLCVKELTDRSGPVVRVFQKALQGVKYWRISAFAGDLFEVNFLSFDQQVAIKQSRRAAVIHAHGGDDPRREVLVTKLAQSMFAPRVVAVHDDPIFDPTYHWIVLQFYPRRDLFNLLNSERSNEHITMIDRDKVGLMFVQLVLAIYYLHQYLSIAHLDLKPSNILISDSGGMMLTDFGVARRMVPRASEYNSLTNGDITNEEFLIRTQPRLTELQTDPSVLWAAGGIGLLKVSHCVKVHQVFGLMGTRDYMDSLIVAAHQSVIRVYRERTTDRNYNDPICSAYGCPFPVHDARYCRYHYSQEFGYDARLSDIYSLGIILFTMLFKVPPYCSYAQPSNRHYRLLMGAGSRNLAESYAVQYATILKNCDNDAFTLIDGMVFASPESRLYIQDVVHHPYTVKYLKLYAHYHTTNQLPLPRIFPALIPLQLLQTSRSICAFNYVMHGNSMNSYLETTQVLLDYESGTQNNLYESLVQSIHAYDNGQVHLQVDENASVTINLRDSAVPIGHGHPINPTVQRQTVGQITQVLFQMQNPPDVYATSLLQPIERAPDEGVDPLFPGTKYVPPPIKTSSALEAERRSLSPSQRQELDEINRSIANPKQLVPVFFDQSGHVVLSQFNELVNYAQDTGDRESNLNLAQVGLKRSSILGYAGRNVAPPAYFGGRPALYVPMLTHAQICNITTDLDNHGLCDLDSIDVHPPRALMPFQYDVGVFTSFHSHWTALQRDISMAKRLINLIQNNPLTRESQEALRHHKMVLESTLKEASKAAEWYQRQHIIHALGDPNRVPTTSPTGTFLQLNLIRRISSIAVMAGYNWGRFHNRMCSDILDVMHRYGRFSFTAAPVQFQQNGQFQQQQQQAWIPCLFLRGGVKVNHKSDMYTSNTTKPSSYQHHLLFQATRDFAALHPQPWDLICNQLSSHGGIAPGFENYVHVAHSPLYQMLGLQANYEPNSTITTSTSHPHNVTTSTSHHVNMNAFPRWDALESPTLAQAIDLLNLYRSIWIASATDNHPLYALCPQTSQFLWGKDLYSGVARSISPCQCCENKPFLDEGTGWANHIMSSNATLFGTAITDRPAFPSKLFFNGHSTTNDRDASTMVHSTRHLAAVDRIPATKFLTRFLGWLGLEATDARHPTDSPAETSLRPKPWTSEDTTQVVFPVRTQPQHLPPELISARGQDVEYRHSPHPHENPVEDYQKRRIEFLGDESIHSRSKAAVLHADYLQKYPELFPEQSAPVYALMDTKNGLNFIRNIQHYPELIQERLFEHTSSKPSQDPFTTFEQLKLGTGCFSAHSFGTQQVSYHVPLDIILPPDFPREAPLVCLLPVNGFSLNTHNPLIVPVMIAGQRCGFVDLPILRNWDSQASFCTLSALLEEVQWFLNRSLPPYIPSAPNLSSVLSSPQSQLTPTLLVEYRRLVAQLTAMQLALPQAIFNPIFSEQLKDFRKMVLQIRTNPISAFMKFSPNAWNLVSAGHWQGVVRYANTFAYESLPYYHPIFPADTDESHTNFFQPRAVITIKPCDGEYRAGTPAFVVSDQPQAAPPIFPDEVRSDLRWGTGQIDYQLPSQDNIGLRLVQQQSTASQQQQQQQQAHNSPYFNQSQPQASHDVPSPHPPTTLEIEQHRQSNLESVARYNDLSFRENLANFLHKNWTDSKLGRQPSWQTDFKHAFETTFEPALLHTHRVQVVLDAVGHLTDDFLAHAPTQEEFSVLPPIPH